MKLGILLFFLFTSLSANVIDKNSYSYEVFKNYKKIGTETYNIENNIYFVLNSKLDITYNKVDYNFFYKTSYLHSDFDKLISIDMKINNKKHIAYSFIKSSNNKNKFIKLSKNSYLFEPLLVSTVYSFLNSKKKNIKLFNPSGNKIIKAIFTYKGYDNKKIKGKYYKLKRYNLIYGNNSFEIFVDKSNLIVFVDWSSLGYTSELKNIIITPFQTDLVKQNYKLIIKKVKINKYPVKIYKYYPKNKKNGKKIFIIDGVMFPSLSNDSGDTLSENIFFNKLINKLSKKGYRFIRYSFEDFSNKDSESLDLSQKYKIIKNLLIKNKQYNNIIAIGWGDIFSFKLLKDFNKKIKKIILLNPMYLNYLTILKAQTELEFFTKKEQISLKKSLRKLIKKVYSNNEVVFNKKIVNSNYFKELFKEKIDNYFKYINKKIKIHILTANYDSDINSSNGWVLYSKIKNNKIKYKEFIGLNHYFYKIPYKSFAFSYNKSFKIDRDFIRSLERVLRK